MHGRHGLVRACGAREIATGLAILLSKNPTPWLWARVGGDVLDIATLASNARRRLRAPARNYSDRSGFPRPPEAMRGVARDFKVPRDMRPADLLPTMQGVEASVGR